MRTRHAPLFALALALAPRAAGAVDRPFVFAEDARVPDQGHVDFLEDSTWGIAPGGAVRPIGAAALGAVGSVHEIGGDVGVVPRVSVHGYGMMELSQTPTEQVFATAGVEARVLAVGAPHGPFQLTFAGGALREFTGAAAVQGRVVCSGTLGRFRLTGDVLVEHSFRPMADTIDIIVRAGVSYAILPTLRAGVEYIGQDLEADLDIADVEGPRHMVGPTLALALLHDRLQFVGGPAFGLTPISPGVVVRLGVVGTL